MVNHSRESFSVLYSVPNKCVISAQPQIIAENQDDNAHFEPFENLYDPGAQLG